MAALDVKFFLWRARMGIQRRDGDTAGMKPVRNGEVQLIWECSDKDWNVKGLNKLLKQLRDSGSMTR